MLAATVDRDLPLPIRMQLFSSPTIGDHCNTFGNSNHLGPRGIAAWGYSGNFNQAPLLIRKW